MTDQLPNQTLQSSNQSAPRFSFLKIKKNYVILGVVILSILLISAYITYGKSLFPLDNLLTSCQPNIERTPNRKTGIVRYQAIEGGNYQDITVFALGADKIVRSKLYGVPIEEHILRGGKVLKLDLSNHTLTVDVGNNHTMKLIIPEGQSLRMRRKVAKYPQPEKENYIEGVKSCNIEKDDLIGIILNESNYKDYDKILHVPAIEIIQ